MGIQSLQSRFSNRIAILATMHQKERAIAPLLAQELGLEVRVPADFNTDVFGTFTREVERPGNQLAAARLKAEKALEITGESLALASEGTFGPHPSFPYLACNREIVILLDRQQDLEIVGQEFSTETNYSHQQVSSLAEAEQFALKVGFPDHGLVVMTNPEAPAQGKIFKGITTPEHLEEAVAVAIAHSPLGKAHLETDMRALYNPTRMGNIAKATQNLIQLLKQHCPKCGWPGFQVQERRKGLPCGLCGLPTSLVKSEIYRCPKCQFSQEIAFPDGTETADPGQCYYCNP